MRVRATAILAAVVMAVAGVGAGALPAQAAAKRYSNCTALNKAYPHGVGKPGARDKVRGTIKPVTNFRRNLSLYNANRHLDRDKDGIACEKR